MTSFGYLAGDLICFKCPICKQETYVNWRTEGFAIFCNHFSWDCFLEAVWCKVDNEHERGV